MGVEHIDMATPVGQGGAKVEQTGARRWFEKAYVQRGGHGLDLVMEKAVGHRCVEQGADHAAVQDARITLPFRSGPDRRNDRARPVRAETQSEQSAWAAGDALCVADGRLVTAGRVGVACPGGAAPVAGGAPGPVW